MFVSLLLLCLIGLCLYLIHTTGKTNAKQHADIRQMENDIAALEEEKQQLEKLLALPPCEARDQMTPSPTPAVSSTVPSPAPAAPTRNPIKNDAVTLLERACVFIVNQDAAGNISTGTGFFVAPDIIVTNAHVVARKNRGILVTSKALGRPVLCDVIARDEARGRDYALLKANLPATSSIVPPAFALQVRKTDKVGSWGFPHIIGQNDPAYKRLLSGSDISAVPELTYSEGVISAVLDRTPPLLVHTAPISPGNSGGPLVNEQGQIVGINTMITLDEDSYRQASIAIDAQDLRQFLSAHGIHVSGGSR